MIIPGISEITANLCKIRELSLKIQIDKNQNRALFYMKQFFKKIKYTIR